MAKIIIVFPLSGVAKPMEGKGQKGREGKNSQAAGYITAQEYCDIDVREAKRQPDEVKQSRDLRVVVNLEVIWRNKSEIIWIRPCRRGHASVRYKEMRKTAAVCVSCVCVPYAIIEIYET